jgi:hypothetical protein
MKVSKVPFQLERVENDDWGNTFPVGANVVRGYYYNRRKQNPFKYELKREERRNKLRSILNLLLYDSMLSRISSCTHSRTEMESRGSIS